MPATTPASGRRRAAAASPRPRPPAHPLLGKHVLVPPAVFPKEKVARGFPGWPAAVVGVEAGERADGLHLVVEFENYPNLYHFPESTVREWAVVAPGGRQAGAAAAAAEGQHRQPRQPEGEAGQAAAQRPSTARRAAGRSGRTPGRRSSEAAAMATARDLKYREGEEEEEEEEEEAWQQKQQQPAASDAAKSAAKGPAAAAVVSPHAARTSTRKRRAEPEAASEQRQPVQQRRRQSAVEQQQQQQQQQQPKGDAEKATVQAEAGSWLDTAGAALRQSVVAAATVGACYALLSTLYPLDALG